LLLGVVPAAGAQQITGTYLTTADVNVRRGPGTSYQVITTIPKGIKVHVVAREGQWLRIESKHGNQPGYISERYAQPLQSQQAYRPGMTAPSVSGAYRTKYETELREGPGLNYKVVTRLPADIKVNVVRAEGDWLRVESKRGDKPGYVDKRAVERWSAR
jgi:uncharacterized protein YgiM (DUF1202 family)